MCKLHSTARAVVRRSRHPSQTAAAVVLLAATTWFAGCGAPTTDGDEAAIHSPEILRRGLGAEPGTLDPQLASDNAALAVAADLYEGLTAEDNDGSVVPGGAESWTVERGGIEYLFRLRRDLRWSNGDALTADHFAAGLRYALDTANGAPYAGLLADVEHIEVTAPDSLRLRLHRPIPYLPAVLALPVAAPRHPHAQSLEPRPANGAYRMARRVPGELIELERNPYHWNAADVAIDRVVHVAVTDLATEVNLYRTGELDLTSEVPNAQLDSLRRTLPGELRLMPYLSVYSYAVNLARLPNRDARLALAMVFESTSPQNTLGYADAEYDRWLAASRSESDATRRMHRLAEAEALLLADVPVIPLFFRVSKRLVKPYVQGVADNPLGHVASRHLRLVEQ